MFDRHPQAWSFLNHRQKIQFLQSFKVDAL